MRFDHLAHDSRWWLALFVFLLALPCTMSKRDAAAVETLILDVSGAFDARTWDQGPATADYDVVLPARGYFRGEVVASPALFGGPDGNNPNYHLSSQFLQLRRPRITHPDPEIFNLGNFSSTNIEVAPITTNASRVIDAGGLYQARIIGVRAISFTFGDFLYGEAQTWAAQAFFDPSPVANAGPNLALESATTGTLLGSGSDVDGDALTYLWTKEFGPVLNLSSTTASQPTIQAPTVFQAVTTRMKLVVSDANSDSAPDYVDVVLYPVGGNIPPFVDPGQGSTGYFDTQIALDGSASYDADGQVTLYSWTQTAGPFAEPPVPMSDPTAATVTFKQYEPLQHDVTYEFELCVSDGKDISAPDKVWVTIIGYHNDPVPVGPREVQIYNDAGSVPEATYPDPPETRLYPGVAVPGKGRLRTEVLGTPGLFGGPDGNNPNYHLSSHGALWDGHGTYGFRQTDIESPPVVANTFYDIDAGGSSTLTVIGPQALSYTFLDFLWGDAQGFNINVWFRPFGGPPTADPGTYPTSVESGTVIQLDGTGSSDPDGQPLWYGWTQTAGPAGTFSNPQSPAPLFKVPNVSQETALEFSLVVSDGRESPPATTTLTVIPAPPDADADGVLDSVEDGAPNAGDGNNDGTLDSQQENVASLPNAVDGRYVTLLSSGTATLINVEAIDNPASDTMPAGAQCPVGFFRFGVMGVDPGEVVLVLMYLPQGGTVNAYLKYGATPGHTAAHWYFFDHDGTTGAQFSAGVVTLSFEDSRRGDGDLRLNRYIPDPGAPAVYVETRTRQWQGYE